MFHRMTYPRSSGHWNSFENKVRDRYIVILNTKTVSVTDIIDAEEAIRLITAEIESKQRRLRFLNDQLALSAVTLTIYEKVKYSDARERFEKDFPIKQVIRLGWVGKR